MLSRFLPFFLLVVLSGSSAQLLAQMASLTGQITDNNGQALDYATVSLDGTRYGTVTEPDGSYRLENIKPGRYEVVASFLGYESARQTIELRANQTSSLNFMLEPAQNMIDEVVVTGTMKEVNRLESPVPVEVYTPKFFQKNPTPNVYEALQTVNGVRPQLNCQVCNTGDIHINGLEGPYTMVLIDGMPIVSSLATVYGLSGIPNSLVERMEVVKGPASSLYGSEAIGGLINIITKSPDRAPRLSVDVMADTWQAYNVDLGFRFGLGARTNILTGVNYFNYDNPIDNNNDNFTDMTLQERVSVFQKWSFDRPNNKLFTLAGRYYWEDRWGGEMQWTPADRGGDQVYGEAITTKRWEFIGQYQLPTVENLMTSVSLNSHSQNSVYGDVPYIADQHIAFGQLTWDKQLPRHDLLVGTALRYTFYDDNTPATGGTEDNPNNQPDEIWLPGIFVQDEIKLAKQHKVLLGLRYDYNEIHGNIFTPRLAYKWSATPNDIFRLNAGTGFRVVNLFTEDHAALTGAREVVIAEELQPERSFNVNANYIKRYYGSSGTTGTLELSAFYTRFQNVILPDYETNPNQIIYDNLDGTARTAGISVNGDLALSNGLSFIAGATFMDVSSKEDGVRERQLLTERFSGTWTVSYEIPRTDFSVDYTGNVYGPMLLPLLSDLDPRPAESPWWSIQNIQLSYDGFKQVELYGGVKNLLNWTPWKNRKHPIIARAFDPFDRNVEFDADGQVIATPDNPYALTFDPAYVYAPNQGIRAFLGVRYTFR